MSTTPVGPTGSPQAGTSQPWVVRVAGRISAILHGRLPRPIVVSVAAALVVAFLIILAIGISSYLPPMGPSRIRNSQDAAMTSLRQINDAESEYLATYNAGFSPTLAALGPPLGDNPPSSLAARLVSSQLANGIFLGYRFTYAPGPPDKAGHIQTYTVNARPLEYGKSGLNNYFTDQTGVIRQTSEDRHATRQDPAIAP